MIQKPLLPALVVHLHTSASARVGGIFLLFDSVAEIQVVSSTTLAYPGQ